jgi:hypothetical protein
LRKALRRFHRARATTRHEREGAGFVGDALRLQLFFGAADPRDLGRGVDHRRNHVVIHVRVPTGDAIGDRDTLFLAFVREHRAAHAVTHRPHVLGSGVTVIVDFHKAARIDTDARALGEQTFGIRTTPDADDQFVDRERLHGTRSVCVGDVDRFARNLGSGHFLRRAVCRDPVF